MTSYSIPISISSNKSSPKTNSDKLNRIAIVTGSNKGIGYQIAYQLAATAKFSYVILACRDCSRGLQARNTMEEKLLHSLSKNNDISTIEKSCMILYLPLTVGDVHTHITFQKYMESKFGKIDVLVNNAETAFKHISTMPFQEQCKPILDVNFRGTVELTERLLPLLRQGTDARIVNLVSACGKLSQLSTSDSCKKFNSESLTISELKSLVNIFEKNILEGTHTDNGWGNSNYGISKLALIAATKIWARKEVHNNIQVNCCCPGLYSTDMSSHNGPYSAEDGAKNAVLLATGDSCGTGLFYENMEVSQC